jgi:elongation factor Ts
VRTVARLALDADGDVQKLQAMPYPGDGIPVAEKLTRLIATIGENMNLRRCALLTVEDGVIGAYVHAAQAEGLGRIGVLTALAGAPANERVQEFGKKLAMHTAAAAPLAVERDSVDPAVVERERRIILEQAQATGKAPQFLEKMVDGRMNKFYQDVCLLEQVYVLDGERRVRAVLEELARDVSAPVRVTGFVRFALGEGVEKVQAA